jgi:hypothetical protein
MKLQMLLHPHHRNSEGIAKAKRISETLGIRPTAEGQASISADVDEEKYTSLFGAEAPIQPPAGPMAAESLTVPEPLQEYVQSISIAPPHLYMNPKP